MEQMVTFTRDSVLPSWVMNSIQRFLSVTAENLRFKILSNTTIEVTAGVNQAASVISIGGKWRWIEASVSRAHPGGVAGTYRVWVTAANNNVVNTPQPNTDLTNYAFDLAITAAGATPTIVPGTVDIFREVCALDWDGVKITGLRKIIDESTPPQMALAAGAPGVTPLTTQGAALQTADLFQVKDSAGVNVAKITAAGLFSSVPGLDVTGGAGLISLRAAATPGAQVLGARAAADTQDRLAISADGKLTFGSGGAAGDTNLYRSAVGTLKMDGRLVIGNGAGGIEFGTDTNLYRLSAGVLKTDGTLNATRLLAGASVPQSDALISARVNGNAVEWGHSAQTGYGSTLGSSAGNGDAHLAFNAEAGATANTFRTRGFAGSVLRSNMSGGFIFSKVAVAAADNQALTTLLGISSTGTIEFGAASDTNLYRSSAGILKTDGSIKATAFAAETSVAADDNSVVFVFSRPADIWQRWQVTASGKIMFGGGTVGPDTNLYRSAADVLRTDDAFHAGGGIMSRPGTQYQVFLDSVGANSGLLFGSAADTNLYRLSAGRLKTDGNFYAAQYILSDMELQVNYAGVNVAERVRMGYVSNAYKAGFDFGSAADTTLYRSAAGTLKTDGSLLTSGLIGVNGLATTATVGLRVGTSGATIPQFQVTPTSLAWGDGTAALDTNLYRSSAGVLRTDGSQIITSRFSVGTVSTAKGQISLGASTAATAGLDFGEDTNLYRSSAGILKTDGTLQATRLSAYAASGGTSALSVFTAGEPQPRLDIYGDGVMRWGSGSAGWDTNLYRSSAGILKTDGVFNAGGALYIGGGGNPHIYFGSANDTNLYRWGAAYLRTGSSFMVDQEFRHLGATAGFYGVAAVAKPNVTGARSETIEDFGGVQQSVGNDLTLGNLLTALASLGLITNSTTA